MVIQARAEATRRRILDAAVGLFAENGYAETGLNEVLQRASVSKGAFYYHFPSKEAVAAAIIENFDQRLNEAAETHFDPEAPRLEGVIAITFAVQHLLRSDTSIRIGHQLSQALDQVSTAGSQIYSGWTGRFVDMVSSAFQAGQVSGDVDPVDASEAVWVSVLGSNLVSAALQDDPFARLTRVWRVLLRSILPLDSWAHFDRVLTRAADSYLGGSQIRPNDLAASIS